MVTHDMRAARKARRTLRLENGRVHSDDAVPGGKEH
jgi:predicted ABC-type transport system involved in lysophospholipase L1 biosynthesis ATPase subunit